MNIVEEIYQHAKQLPTDKALEILNFITAIETQNQAPILKSLTTQEFQENALLEFLQTLPVAQNRSDAEINQEFQSIRNEWRL